MEIKMKQKLLNKAFTLIELIVVLGIMAILLGMFWMYFNNLFIDARNADRKINVTLIANALKEFWEAKMFYPLPDNITVTAIFFENAWVARRQWEVRERMWQTVQGIQHLPKDKMFWYYKYSVDALSRQFQVYIPLEKVGNDPPYYIRGVFSNHVMAVNSGNYVMVQVPSMFLVGSYVINSTGNQFITMSGIVEKDIKYFDVSCIINSTCVENLQQIYEDASSVFWLTQEQFLTILKRIAGIDYFLNDGNVEPY